MENLPSKEKMKEILFDKFNLFTNRKIPSTAYFVAQLYCYKWVNYATTYEIVDTIRKLYFDHKAKKLI